MGCYKCGGPHYKTSCPLAFPAGRTAPPGPGPTAGPEQWKPSDVLAFPARRDPAPPSPAYLRARDAAGMPSPGLPSPLAVPCPWCRAGAWQACRNTATGRPARPHRARTEPAPDDAA